MEPLINILIRTSNRPTLYKRCIESVRAQTYKNVRVIVSWDQCSAWSYISNTADLYLEVFRDKSKPFFYNTYINDLKCQVNGGWFMCMDDDDFLDSPKALETLSKQLYDPLTAIICQFRRKGRPKPADSLIDRGIIKKGHIGLPCIILHYSAKNKANMKGDVDYDDYNFIKEISEKMPVRFVKQVVVCTDRRSWGKPEETPEKEKQQ